MSAHEQYALLVGEIGTGRSEYLYEMPFWEILMTVRGHGRRRRDLWSAVRWSTYHVILSWMGSESMHKNGIYRPADLLKLEWDEDVAMRCGDIPSEEDARAMQAELDAINAALLEKAARQNRAEQ